MGYELRVGQPVYSLDGDGLGRVKEVGESQFKVDAPMRPDYWLSRDCLSAGSAADDCVIVKFEKDRLGDFITGPRPSMTGNR